MDNQLSVFIGQANVIITHRERVGDHIAWAVEVDGELLATMQVPDGYWPRIAIGNGRVAIFANVHAAFVQIVQRRISVVRMSEIAELTAAYWVNDIWLFVGELGVLSYDDSENRIVSTLMTDDVVLSRKWDRGDLVLRDFKHREYRISIGPGAQLKPTASRSTY